MPDNAFIHFFGRANKTHVHTPSPGLVAIAAAVAGSEQPAPYHPATSIGHHFQVAFAALPQAPPHPNPQYTTNRVAEWYKIMSLNA